MKKWKKAIRQTMAVVLTAALIGSSPDLFVFAQDEKIDQGTGTITAFTELPEEIRTQTYDTGTIESQIHLPETLEVELMVSDNVEKEPEEGTTESGSTEEREDQTSEETSKEYQAEEDQQEETKTEDQQKPVEESTTESTKEPVEEIDTTENPQEVDEDIVTSMLDMVVPSVTVHAAETSNKKTVTLEGIRWKIDAAKSDSGTFQSETPASYTYVPVLPETVELDSHTYKLEMGEETATPEITVTIREKEDTEQSPKEATDPTEESGKSDEGENSENPADPSGGGEIGQIISVDVSWGNMAYTYSDAKWDTGLHTYGEGQWTTDDGGNCITVQNKGNAEISVSYAYSQSVAEVSGRFADTGGNQINLPVTLPEGEKKEVDLTLTGKPSSELNSCKLGTVTITIGGKE